MAPKRQGDGAAESKTRRVGRPRLSAKQPEAVPKPWLDSGANAGLNANVWAQHQEHVQVVLGHPCFTDALTSSPAGIATATAGDEDNGDAGGYMDVYNQDKALASLASLDCTCAASIYYGPMSSGCLRSKFRLCGRPWPSS